MTYISVDVDADDVMHQLSDEDIRAEYIERRLGGGAENWDEHTELQKAYMYHHNGNRDAAYDILWRMCLVKLNKVV